MFSRRVHKNTQPEVVIRDGAEVDGEVMIPENKKTKLEGGGSA